MAEFKKYMTPGSFGQNQLKRPSEVAKISKETARRSRGMQRAQDLEQRNRAVYLRAQQFAQSQEQEQRENNFRIETENRQAYKDALTRDYEIERANAEAEGAAYQKALSDLTNFSTTAAELAGQYAKSVQEANDTAAKDNIYRAGITLDKLTALQSLNDNLTRAELFQTQFMRDVNKNEDLTESQKDAYFKTYLGRNTRAYAENEALLQQEAGTYISFLDAGMSADDVRDLSPQEKIDLIPQLRAQFLNTDNLKNQRGELLETSGLYSAMRGIENQLVQQLQTQVAQERADRVEFDLNSTIIRTLHKDGEQGVMALLAENPGQEMAMDIVRAYESAAGGSGPLAIRKEHVDNLLGALTDNNGTMIPFEERYIGSDAITAAYALQRKLLRQQNTDYDLARAARNNSAEQQIAARADELGKKGFYDGNDIQILEDMQETLAAPGYESPTLEEVRNLTMDARAEQGARELLQKARDTGLLSMQLLNSMQLNSKLIDEFEEDAIRADKQKQSPAMKAAMQRVRDRIAGNPLIAADIIAGEHKAGLSYVQDEFALKFKLAVKDLTLSGLRDDAEIIKLAEVAVMKEVDEFLDVNNGAYDSDTGFAMYNQYLEGFQDAALKGSINAQPVLKALADPNFKTDPKILAKALSENAEGKNMIMGSYDAYRTNSADWQPLPIIRELGTRLKMDPLAVYNFLAPEFGQKKLKLKNDTLQSIKENLEPHLKRNFDFYPTDESIARSTAYIYGRVKDLPVRSAFEESGLLPLIRGGEAAGNYNAANRGVAGDTPAGIVNLDTLSVGSWNKFYDNGWNALGAYQLIRSTFRGSVKRLGFDRNTIMDKDNQDLVAIELIAGGTKRPALSAYLNGESDDLDAAVRDLYLEWAAFATETGNSAYDGIAGNAANVSNEQARKHLFKLRKMLTSTR